MNRIIASCIATALSTALAAPAQISTTPETRNAALRYWMAFALMQDLPADDARDKLSDRILSGQSAWDESRLGPVIDRNMEAILTMQRGAQLPDCNWGLEYDLGPEAPVAHLAKARVLARLNALYVARMCARRENAKAVEAWLDGLRFSQHLAQDAPLSGLLT